MSSLKAPEHHAHEPGHDEVFHQYKDIEQQNESYIVGMWAFLVTEVMFFGGLFLAYMIYRWQNQESFYYIHKTLDWKLGGLNTFILLASSFSMAMAVHNAQLKNRAKQLQFLGFTMLCAFGFLVVKFFEWKLKFEHGVLPGPAFSWPYHTLQSDIAAQYGADVGARVAAVPSGTAQLFFSLYFAMTGLHGVHVVIGIISIAVLMFMTVRKYPQVESYIPTECVGLYWHFVDLVWIFLYPLFYLIPN